ncbi:MAG TPA: M28 family peptidase [Flavobacteriales bacterium]|nr:M28 family peptidase [Flavobacteriales bacterium]
MLIAAMRSATLTLLILWAQGIAAQEDTIASRYARLIDVLDLRRHLEILASDSFMGRDTGKEGQKLAAVYLKERFKEMGVPPLARNGVEQGYFQPYELIESKKGTISVRTAKQELNWPKDVLYFVEDLDGSFEINRLVPVGAEDLGERVDFSRAAAVLDARSLELGGSGFRAVQERLEGAKSKGFRVALIVVKEELKEQLTGFVHVGATTMRLPAADEKEKVGSKGIQPLYITEKVLVRIAGRPGAKALLNPKGAKGTKASIVVVREQGETRVQAENVLAFIEGTDKRDEVIVITAHYDHIGVEDGVVYNGADDDGSGTVALIEIAEAFMRASEQGDRPRRSILVMPVSGEEKGLLGSRYYSDNPVFPMEQTVANLNIDMIGRVDSAHLTTAPYVYIIGSDRLSSDLHAVNEEANARHVGIVLDYTFNSEDDPNRFYYRSDHYNFARKGVPCIFYFSGVHEDYHQPGDDVEKIRFDLLESRAKLVFHTAWILANRSERIQVDKPVR